jgi:hypothetical protein
VDDVLNVAFFVLHTAWIAFICLGWMWRRTRPWQLAAALLTALSWFGLGFWYGWGYCPCTDWHWQIRSRMGLDDPPSYVQLLIGELTGIVLERGAADALALAVLTAVTLLSVRWRLRDRLQSHQRRESADGTPFIE